MTEELLPALRTAVTMPDYVRAVVRSWPAVGEAVLLEESIAVLWAQYMIETGGRSCFNWNIGNAKHVKGDGHDYHMLHGVWEGVLPAVAMHLIASGQAKADPSEAHAKAVGPGRVSVVFNPPHPATWFRAYRTLDEGVVSHLRLLSKRFARAWPAVLDGDLEAFAKLLKEQRYFTASAEAYANGMRGHFRALIASTTYEELLATPTEPPEAVPEHIAPDEAEVWDRDGELGKLISVMHRGATGLIIEDALEQRKRDLDGEEEA